MDCSSKVAQCWRSQRSDWPSGPECGGPSMKSMRMRSGLAEPPLAVPPDIYIPLVDSLYKDGRTLFTGTLFVVGSILTTFWKTGEFLFLACAFAVVAVACTRGVMMRAYAQVRITVKSNGEARKWDLHCLAGAGASAGMLGIWRYIAFSRPEDAFAR